MWGHVGSCGRRPVGVAQHGVKGAGQAVGQGAAGVAGGPGGQAAQRQKQQQQQQEVDGHRHAQHSPQEGAATQRGWRRKSNLPFRGALSGEFSLLW